MIILREIENFGKGLERHSRVLILVEEERDSFCVWGIVWALREKFSRERERLCNF